MADLLKNKNTPLGSRTTCTNSILEDILKQQTLHREDKHMYCGAYTEQKQQSFVSGLNCGLKKII